MQSKTTSGEFKELQPIKNSKKNQILKQTKNNNNNTNHNDRNQGNYWT